MTRRLIILAQKTMWVQMVKALELLLYLLLSVDGDNIF